MERIEKIINKYTEGNYLLSGENKQKMISEILNLFPVSESDVERYGYDAVTIDVVDENGTIEIDTYENDFELKLIPKDELPHLIGWLIKVYNSH